ncbi:GATOR complex protein DEPDC5 isoform X3 [Anoplophora glabripennis]|uniref:GATOR complex protein DEPDC5 isoform X3 n=1 Tax=Anoplophora glabripennis TaxID=217634 RepID=UPI000874BDE8|nr:GATOR complex protein DEPDC5 isoform X3 [Anoplophora glabripennis]
MKSFRLIVHQKNFSDEDLIINQKDYPEAKRNHIVEIYHPPPPEEEHQKTKNKPDVEEEFPRLLLQIKSFGNDLLQTRETISVEQSIASAFGLQTYKNVTIRLVNPADVALDSIELTFKDQYMGRSEMWRLKNSLVNTCVYMNKKLEFCGGAVRCQVYEMWAQGDRVACGVITDDTKVVFRSSTAMVYIFLQMSSEMWDFDIYGDLYFEKAVNGFLSDLFMKWKKNGSNHEVTIVLFSRTFYEASSLEEFPQHMRECLQKDYKGRYYEDFYRVAVQNERYDDWSGFLVQLRHIFQNYLKVVLEYHSRPDQVIPAATNSTAAQGNFLEVLNMSLNVFEKHYLDRSFDRTGQLSVVVTPGVGVFEVDRELTNITKQRIIDNGVGSDLVCVGEQPLHAVPLLKFHNKDTHLNVPDDYSMPHWINLSFYSTNKKIAYSNFIPRIKLPPPLPDGDVKKDSPRSKLLPEDEYIHNSFFDYDAYDAKIFQMPPAYHSTENSTLHHKVPPRYNRFKRSSGSLLDSQDFTKGQRRKMSDPDIPQRINSNPRSEPIAIPSATYTPVVSPHADVERELSPPPRMVVGSEGSPPFESKALINPFDPSHVTIKLTSNRRRWTHIFPKGPTGVLIQQHHYQAVPAQPDKSNVGNENLERQISSSSNLSKSLSATAALQEYCKKRPNSHNTGHSITVTSKNSMKSSTLLWGATGEQEWTPALTTVNDVLIGVDWKSLTIPACLPITTDYFPDKRALNIDYVVSLYSLLPDSVNADFAQQRATYKKPLTTMEVFKELISQRLAQGFQLILMADSAFCGNGIPAPNPKMRGTVIRKSPTENDESYYLSIGRLFHKISLSGNTISVTRYRPRHPYPGFNYQYRYRFYAPWHDTYEESFASFTTEKLEHFNWNYLDHYVCTGGDTEFVLVDALKYWRFRVYLLPLNNTATKKIIEGNDHCDIYTLPTNSDHQQMVDGLIKFIETAVNKIKRSSIPKKPRMSLSILSLPPLAQPRRNSMSNFSQNTTARSSERYIAPSLRSGSKVMDRSRTSQSSQESSCELREGHEMATDENTVPTIMLLKSSATGTELIEAMKHPTSGLSFINLPQNLPNFTFVTADSVNWLMTHMEGVTSVEKGVQVMQTLHKEQLIRHGSGDVQRSFLYGFYLFYIVYSDKDDKDILQPCGDIQGFENEWMEVEVKPPLNWGLNTSPVALKVPNSVSDRERGVPHFLCEDIDAEYSDCDVDGIMYNRMRLETDVTGKSDRVEWGHTRYQTVFRPDQAYELVVEWLTSSGSIVFELLSGWHRKAQSCGLQMIPIPHDPLALPYSNKSDPLRGPIFVPLNIKCLEERDRLFKEFKEDTYTERLFLFQEAIVQRFGFISCRVEHANKANRSSEHQYIHATGTVFILVSSAMPKIKSRTSSSVRSSTGRYSVHADVVPSPHEAYITRHVSGKNKDDYDNSRKMGFLWCWNHMVSKRWRTNQGVDTNFQLKLLRDFREFCINSEDRLRTFWQESWDAKETAMSFMNSSSSISNNLI